MRYKQDVSDSGSTSKSPSKRTTKDRNPSTQNLTGENEGDSEQYRSVKFRRTEGSSVQGSHDELEEEQNSEPELITQQNEVTEVQISQNNCSPQKKASVKSIFSVEDLSPDDEIYILQCPQNYNKQDLVSKNLDFTKSNPSVTIKGEVFQVQLLNSDKKFITLAVPKNESSGSLMILPLKGHIIIQKTVDIYNVDPMDDEGSVKDKVKFPDDIKVRHPLLGVDWKAHVDLADAAFIRDSSFRKKIKKRKKEKTAGEDYVEIKKIKEEESSGSDFATPKKKRRKVES